MKKSPSRHPGFLSPGTKVDGFLIQERLSSGGFGVVYLATLQGRSYALKFALRQASSGPHDRKLTDERMKRELGCLLRLKHPNIVGVFAHRRWPGLEDGYFYIAMEYVKGDNLRVWAARHRPSLRQALRLFIALADALDAAHQQGTFHRDLKPANILVRPTGEPVIVDWGAGDYVLSAPLTQEHLPPGTPAYRSPESLRFARLHANEPGALYEFQPTDDLYSLGVTFYELLTGQSPFFYSAAERTRLDAEIELRIPTPPHEVHSAIPVPLSEGVMRLLSKEPRQRHATAEALKRDLASLDDGSAAWEALLPVPDGWEEPDAPAEAGPPRAPRLSRRLWWGVVLAAGVGGVALAASTFTARMRPAASTPPPARETAPTPVNADTHPRAPSPSPAPSPQPAPEPPLPSSSSPDPLVAREDDRPMKKKPSQAQPPSNAKRTPAPAPGTPPWCLMVPVAIAAANASCATLQARPPPGDCPPEATAAMRARDWLDKGDHGWDFWVQLGNSGSTKPDALVLHGGDLLSRVVDNHRGPNLPVGTLLHGRLWTGDPAEKIAWARWTKAEFPDGRKIPVCIVSFPLAWQEGSTPDAPVLETPMPAHATTRWGQQFE